jgi:hypothetical protein
MTPYHNFHLEGLASVSEGGGGSRHLDQPVRTNITCGLEHIARKLVEYLTFVGNRPGKDDIESRDAVGSDHQQQVFTNTVHIPNLSTVKACLPGKLQSIHAVKLGLAPAKNISFKVG